MTMLRANQPATVWMRHPDVENPAAFPAAAVEAWEKRGWVVCDAPPDVDPAIAHRIADVEQVAYPDGVTAGEVPDDLTEREADSDTEKTQE